MIQQYCRKIWSDKIVYQIMQPRRQPPIVFRPENVDPQQERRRLMEEIEEKKQILKKTDYKLIQYSKECKKMMESNERNLKRVMRHRARLEELRKHQNEPEYFLYMCGFMNEYMQEFMLCHNANVMEMGGEDPNPDNMTYEQLLELGESIGKVSKGISKEQFDCLARSNKIKSDQACPICCTEFSMGERGVILNCKHLYHEECILEWLKDENTCPICKKHVLE